MASGKTPGSKDKKRKSDAADNNTGAQKWDTTFLAFDFVIKTK